MPNGRTHIHPHAVLSPHAHIPSKIARGLYIIQRVCSTTRAKFPGTIVRERCSYIDTANKGPLTHKPRALSLSRASRALRVHLSLARALLLLARCSAAGRLGERFNGQSTARHRGRNVVVAVYIIHSCARIFAHRLNSARQRPAYV